MDITLGIMPARIVVFLAALTLINAQWKSSSNYPGGPKSPPEAPRRSFRFGRRPAATNPPMNFGYRPNQRTYPNNNNINNAAPPPIPRAPSPPINYGTPPPTRSTNYQPPPANYQPPATNYQPPPPTSYQPPPTNYNPPPPTQYRPPPPSAPAPAVGFGAGIGAASPFGGADRAASCHLMCQMSGNMEINPRCGYDGKSYKNECYLRCGMTEEACDTPCPCYIGISSGNGYMMPAKGVFPPAPGTKKNRRKRGRRPECKNMHCPFTNEMICTDTNEVMSECEAYCTYKGIKCDNPCHLCRARGRMAG